jgi:hypothetical protein
MTHNKKWNKNSCILEALKYTNRNDWERFSPESFNFANKNKWFFIRHRDRTLEECKEDALKYKYKVEWQKHSRGAYNFARKRGWLDLCTSHMIQRGRDSKWTLELCKLDAAKHKTISEWRMSSAYPAAVKNGWLVECRKAFDVKITLKECKVDALNYSSRTEWRLNSSRIFNQAKKNDWLNECCGHMKRTKSARQKKNYSLEECKKDALKYKTKSKWMESSSSICAYARKNDWLDKCCSHMTVKFKWTLELCIAEAKKYNNKSEWSKGHNGTYLAAKRYGWFDECCLLLKEPVKHYSLEECKEDALKYKTKSKWMESSSSICTYARKNDWLDKCCSHMTVKFKWTLELCIAEAKKYNNKSEWSKGHNGTYLAAKRYGWFDECCLHFKE